MRPAFLDQHSWWTVTRRESLTRAEYASPITRYDRTETREQRIAGALLAVVIGVGLAAWLVIWWSS